MAPMIDAEVCAKTEPIPISPSTRRAVQLPPSLWTAEIHPLHKQVISEVEGYFLQHWPFPNDQSRKKFRSAGFSRVTCLYFPKALDDRIHFACRLLTLLFLIDGRNPIPMPLMLETSGGKADAGNIQVDELLDVLEHMSLDDGRAYNERLMPLFRGTAQPDRSTPVEWIGYDLWEAMRAHDRDMADEILEPVFVFMRAQTDPKRLTEMELGRYLEYREADVGKA